MWIFFILMFMMRIVFEAAQKLYLFSYSFVIKQTKILKLLY